LAEFKLLQATIAKQGGGRIHEACCAGRRRIRLAWLCRRRVF
jgi:hypothetical protein